MLFKSHLAASGGEYPEVAEDRATIALPGEACQPGLDYLNAIDQLLIHQRVELFEGGSFTVLASCVALEQNYWPFAPCSHLRMRREKQVLGEEHHGPAGLHGRRGLGMLREILLR